MTPKRLFVTGATGYVGGRLVPELLLAGHRVRCLARNPKKLEDRPWLDPYFVHPLGEATASDLPRVDIAQGDMSDADELAQQMDGCLAAYFLVHSMAGAKEYAERDKQLATTFATAARKAGVEHIIYLGGLGETHTDKHLSEHLRSRHEVEHALRSAGVPVTAFRAAMIIGSGSASFEILRYLVERLPVMITPKWVRTECQPIGIRNVLHYLVACLDTPATIGETLDIGGKDVVTYDQLMRIVQEERGLARRLVFPVPVLSPRLSSYWLHLTTPVTTSIARPLTEGLKNRVVCRDMRAAELMPPPNLLSAREAVRLALRAASLRRVETRWSAAGPIPGDPDWAGGTLFNDERERRTNASPDAVFAAICRLGGGHGWYAVNWLWRLRGLMDQLVGGPGLRRGRRDPETLRYGEALDFWRVIHLEKDRRLTLLAEMKVPGLAQLEYRIQPNDQANTAAGCTLTQEARFQPKGLLGLAYWYSVLPFHALIFPAMLTGILRAAEKQRTHSTHAAETA